MFANKNYRFDSEFPALFLRWVLGGRPAGNSWAAPSKNSVLGVKAGIMNPYLASRKEEIAVRFSGTPQRILVFS